MWTLPVDRYVCALFSLLCDFVAMEIISVASQATTAQKLFTFPLCDKKICILPRFVIIYLLSDMTGQFLLSFIHEFKKAE